MPDLLSKWKSGLSRTKNQTFGRIASLLGTSEIRPDTWEDLEALLLQSDLGSRVTQSILRSLTQKVKEQGLTNTASLRVALRVELVSRLFTKPVVLPPQTPAVILVVGVNGSGKTTSIAKLAGHFQTAGKKVIIAAADTFRAAAVDQLKVWGDRLGVPVISGQPEADPGSVVYDAINAAVAKKADVLLIDTAGRLHTRYNLMEELKKVHRVCGKTLVNAPHNTWLVLDATTGQNAFQQAKVFQEAVNVDGVILAKLDSSAKGGMAFSIQEELKLPILFVGLGEQLDDLVVFNPEEFVGGILGE